MKFTSIFFKTNESILEIHLKDTNKRAKTYQVYLNIFHSERKYLNDFVVKIHKIAQQKCRNQRKMYFNNKTRLRSVQSRCRRGVLASACVPPDAYTRLSRQRGRSDSPFAFPYGQRPKGSCDSCNSCENILVYV